MILRGCIHELAADRRVRRNWRRLRVLCSFALALVALLSVWTMPAKRDRYQTIDPATYRLEGGNP